MLQQFHTSTSHIKSEKLKTRSIQLHVGAEAISTVSDPAFVQQWMALYEACPWATTFESPSFVNTWYECYKHKYLPIVVTETRGDQLTGLLTMALLKSTSGGKLFIVHAGHGEADCQAWLSQEEAMSDQFITIALELIFKIFPKEDILIRHIAPGTPIGWATATRAWVNRCIIETFDRPLIAMKDFSLSRRDRKRISKLKSIATFEVITDTQTLQLHLDEIGAQYDFRHGAMFNRTPFKNDASYSQSLISLFEQGVIVVTILKVNGKVIASLAATVGKNKAHLGSIICHSPMYAAYSPGIVLFLLTSQYFADQGYDYFDLTPGGDPYKDRLATGFDKVHTMVITNNWAFYLWRHFRNHVQATLAKKGIDPIGLKFLYQKKKYLYKEKGLGKILNFRKGKALQNQTIYKFGPKDILPPICLPPVNKNLLDDLLKYNSHGSELTQWEFWEAAMRRLESGLQVYTLVDTENLLCAVWVKPHNMSQETENATHLPANATVLSNVYCHPSAKCDLGSFISAVLHNDFEQNQTQEAYIIINNPDTLRTLRLQQVKNHSTDSKEIAV